MRKQQDYFIEHLKTLWYHHYMPDESVRGHLKFHEKDTIIDLSNIFYLSKKHGRTFEAESTNIISILSVIRDGKYGK